METLAPGYILAAPKELLAHTDSGREGKTKGGLTLVESHPFGKLRAGFCAKNAQRWGTRQIGISKQKSGIAKFTLDIAG